MPNKHTPHPALSSGSESAAAPVFSTPAAPLASAQAPVTQAPVIVLPPPVPTSSASPVPPVEAILEELLAHNAEADTAMVKRAYEYSSASHAGQLRLSGEPYFAHPASVALTLAEMGFDEHTVAAGLLHDTVEDTSASIEELDSHFGEQVADIVDGVTKISLMTFDTKEEAQAENIRKMILAMSHDMRVPLVKLADRQHNMRTLEFQKPHKQVSIAQETMDIYAPLANRLGLHRIKLELEDLSFRYLMPDAYAQITNWLEENQMEERQLISKVISRLEEIMEANGIQGRVFGRIKHKYSIYKKMTQQELTLDEMHDIIAFRVIVAELKDCYAVLGLVHALWRPVPGRFKDYISMPKANGYQSLHSTVIGPEGERVEIQIRTEEMHSLAEHGVASHWLYKERDHALSMQDSPQFQWLRDIMARQQDESDSKEFMQSLKMDLFKDEVYVFTPKGAVKELPEGATPLDFAFLIHTDIGFHCVGAKVNGKICPLSTTLKSGDTVEILTDKNRRPNRDWLKFVKTSKARSRIQHFLRTEERGAAVDLGREMLEKEGRKLGVNVAKAIKDNSIHLLLQEFSFGSVDEMCAAVGYARHTPKRLLSRYLAITQPAVHGNQDDNGDPITPITPVPKGTDAPKQDGITIQGLDDMLVHFARCCNPLPGDPVVGFISRGRGVIIHTAHCPHIQTLESERLVSVSWSKGETKPFPAKIHIIVRNTKGMLAKIGNVFSEEDINIDTLSVYSLPDGKSEMETTVEVRDTAQLYQTMDKLRTVDGILEVTRASSENE